jgi:hypothetical protein
MAQRDGAAAMRGIGEPLRRCAHPTLCASEAVRPAGVDREEAVRPPVLSMAVAETVGPHRQEPT